jgi:alpha-tubulin suppressor-like RCC1 family protein
MVGGSVDAAGVAHIQAVPFRSVTCGSMHACGVTESGELWCWGVNRWETPVRVDHEPRLVATASDVATAAAGDGFIVYVNRGGNVRQLGRYGGLLASVDDVIPENRTWASVSVNREHACGLTPSGEAWCWGQSVDPAPKPLHRIDCVIDGRASSASPR